MVSWRIELNETYVRANPEAARPNTPLYLEKKNVQHHGIMNV